MGQNAPPESGNPKSGRARADFCWGGIRAGQQKPRAEEIQGVQILSAESIENLLTFRNIKKFVKIIKSKHIYVVLRFIKS